MAENGSSCIKNGEFFNPVLAMGTQVSCILVISHFFQLLLKPLGQPAPVAQLLAGFVLGPSGFSRIASVKQFFFQNFAANYYETMALYCRMIIMFLLGLEMDNLYIKRNWRLSLLISSGSCFVCTIFAIAVTSFMYEETGARGSAVTMGLTLVVILSNTATPFLVRLAHDLKFACSDIGRLAVSASIIGDTYATSLLIILSIRNGSDGSEESALWGRGFLGTCFVVVFVAVNIFVVNWLNRRNRRQKYLKNAEIFVLLAIVFVAATTLESLGYSSIMACFFVGFLFPRGGRAARTLLTKVSYFVNNFVFPIYFGYTGFKADLALIRNFRNFVIVAIIILLSIGGKVTGTLAVCFYAKFPLSEGVLLAFMMNLKGHVDLLALSIGVNNSTVIPSQVFLGLMMTAVVVNSLICGPLIAFMVRRESDITGYKHISFEFQSPESELKLLACVHGPRPVAAMLGLIATSRGPETAAITPYLTHLIELPKRTNVDLLYHQKEEDELSDDESYGGNDVIEINEAVDIFVTETREIIHQLKFVSPFASMHEDVCEFAEEIRADIIILSYHKHQRIDGKLESGKEGIRITNQKILRHAKCSVAVLIDRGLTVGTLYPIGSDSLQHVATLFFGGPDDREALGFSKRLGMHHHINLTIIRFLHTSERRQDVEANCSAREGKDVLMSLSGREPEKDADNAALTDFYNRYVTSGQIGYVEKHVADGRETTSALRDMSDMYSMFIVGKGGRGHSTLTTGMSDWEECPELGKVGDLLASSEFDLSGSVLVIQQHRPSLHEDTIP